MSVEQKHAEAELEKTLNTLSEDEINALAGGKMTEAQRKKLEKALAIAIPAGSALAVTIGLGAAAIKGKKDYADFGHYFKYPFGKGYDVGNDPNIPESLYGNGGDDPYGFVPPQGQY